MTLSDDDFRDFAALAAMINLAKQIDWQDAIDPALAKHVASQCFNIADAMLEESQRRRSAGTPNHPVSPDSCDDPGRIKAPEGKYDIRSWDIDILGLPRLQEYWIRRMGVKTLGSLINYSKADLMAQPEIGKKTIQHIEERLKQYGLCLSEDPVEY